MANISVYWHSWKDSDGDVNIAVTEKAFWDKNRYIDEYGDSEHDEEISDAMESCGAIPTVSPYYILDDNMTVESVVEKMRGLGFEMLADKNFAECAENG